MSYTQTRNAQQVVDEWNKQHKIGASVLVKRIDNEVFLGETRSKAFVSEGGRPVVLLVGYKAVYPLERVAPVKQSQIVDPALGTSAFIALGNPEYGQKDGEMSETLNEYRARRINELLPDAIALAQKNGAIKISDMQRMSRIGYTLAAAVIEEMQRRGLIGLQFDQAAGGFVWVPAAEEGADYVQR